MFYGHGGWAIFVVFGVLFVMRMLSSKRRQGAQQQRRAASSSFIGFPPGRPGTPPDEPSSPAPRPSTGIAPGWFPDPTGQHDQRYWSGSDWTEHVTDAGAPSTDPPPQSLKRDGTT